MGYDTGADVVGDALTSPEFLACLRVEPQDPPLDTDRQFMLPIGGCHQMRSVPGRVHASGFPDLSAGALVQRDKRSTLHACVDDYQILIQHR